MHLHGPRPRWLLLGTVLAVALGLAGPAVAADPLATTLTLTARGTYADSQTTLRLALADRTGAPVAEAAVALERRLDGAWVALDPVTTDAAGRASLPVTLSRQAGENEFRASYAGSATYAASRGRVQVELVRRQSTLVLSGPRSVVDERRVEIRIRWRAGNGEPVTGTVRLARALGAGKWTTYRTLTTDARGTAQVRVAPRRDSRWRATGVGRSWVEGARSAVHRIDNLPPGTPVRLPRGAPRPRRHLPAQGHGVGAGPHLVVGRVPGPVWRDMRGVSWRPGCPVGRAGLKLVRVNYWDYSGYRRRGALVAAAAAARPMGAALAQMYRRELPVRAMYRVDRFGWSARSHGGDDYASMAAGNTSAFNCRDVTGRPGVTSPHSYGRSLDLNTWENPYRSARGLVPNTWWQSRSHPRVAWRSRTHEVVEIMTAHGFRWTYGLGDTQHFDWAPTGRVTGRVVGCRQFCD